jgi:hypothetical protein
MLAGSSVAPSTGTIVTSDSNCALVWLVVATLTVCSGSSWMRFPVRETPVTTPTTTRTPTAPPTTSAFPLELSPFQWPGPGWADSPLIVVSLLLLAEVLPALVDFLYVFHQAFKAGRPRAAWPPRAAGPRASRSLPRFPGADQGGRLVPPVSFECHALSWTRPEDN